MEISQNTRNAAWKPVKRDFLIVKLRSFIDADPMHQTFWCRTSGAKKKKPSSFTLSISLGLEKCVPPLSRFLADWRASGSVGKNDGWGFRRFVQGTRRPGTAVKTEELLGWMFFCWAVCFFLGLRRFWWSSCPGAFFMVVASGLRLVNSSLEKGQRFN